MALHIEEGKAGRPYDAYMSLPLELRREVYLRLMPETKAAVWKAHFQYRLSSPPLTPRRQESVQKADELITAELYGPFADRRRLVHTVESARPWFEPALSAFVFYARSRRSADRDADCSPCVPIHGCSRRPAATAAPAKDAPSTAAA